MAQKQMLGFLTSPRNVVSSLGSRLARLGGQFIRSGNGRRSNVKQVFDAPVMPQEEEVRLVLQTVRFRKSAQRRPELWKRTSPAIGKLEMSMRLTI